MNIKDNKKIKIKKIVGVVIIIGSFFLIIRGLYAYFFLKGLSLSILLVGSLFFGVCGIIGVILFTSKNESIFINSQEKNKKQAILMSIYSAIFSICMLYGALFSDLSFSLKLILFIAFLFFSIGSIVTLIKTLILKEKE